MYKYLYLLVLFLIISFAGLGQTSRNVNTGPQPVGGSNAVALTYYKINFTKAQRQQLAGQELELIFNIDKAGLPTLEKVNGLTDRAILDSLYRTTQKLPAFTPGQENGVAVNTVYFIKFSFPAYQASSTATNYATALAYQKQRLEDFEYITKSGQRLDITFGGVANGFSGSAAQYSSMGGGMKIDMNFTGAKSWGAGMTMSIYGNKLKKHYPIASSREQNSAPPTMLLGITLNKYVTQKERRDLSLQLELCYAIQNITAPLDEADKGWTQFQGFSPGLVVHYALKLGSDKPYYYYGNPSLFSNYINLHGAVRPLFLDHTPASGVMVEAGVSYRFGMHYVSAFKLKPAAQN